MNGRDMAVMPQANEQESAIYYVVGSVIFY